MNPDPEKAYARWLNGMDTLSSAIEATFGPVGQFKLLDKSTGMISVISEGAAVAKGLILEDPYEAVSNFSETIEIRQEYFDSYYYRAITFLIIEQYEQGLADINIFIGYNKSNANAFYIRGMCYSNLGEKELAIEDLEVALEIGLDKSTANQSRAMLETLKK